MEAVKGEGEMEGAQEEGNKHQGVNLSEAWESRAVSITKMDKIECN